MADLSAAWSQHVGQEGSLRSVQKTKPYGRNTITVVQNSFSETTTHSSKVFSPANPVSSQATKKVSVASADPEDCALSTFPQVLKAFHQIPTLGSCLLSSWEVTALKKTNAMCMCV